MGRSVTEAPATLHALPAPRLRALDGTTELAVAEAAAASRSRPEAVTAIIAALFETIDGRPATTELARALPSGTREWLLQWSAYRLNPGTRWFEAECVHCGAPYDLALDLSHPVYRGAAGAPTEVTVETSLGTRSFAVPTGAHEEQLAETSNAGDPRRVFAALCGLSEAAAGDASQFDEHDLQLIDEALEAASPDAADAISATCPDCGRSTESRIDPLLFAFPDESRILRDIHVIAGAYGWPPDAILRLSARHRAFHAGMIAGARRDGQPGGRR